MAEALFMASNLLIAVDYFLLGIFFLQSTHLVRLRVRPGMPVVLRPRRLAMVAYLALGTFFLGCMHTHIQLFLTDDRSHDWHSWWVVASHIAQGLAGLVFWWLARHHLIVNIFDRICYEEAVSPDSNARLDRLKAELEVYRRDR